MLLTGSRLLDTPIMSLQTGTELARTSRPIIDPRNLEIVAYELTGPLLNTHPSLLRIADVREFSDIGIIVDSSDEFVAPEDIIKLNTIYELDFALPGMTVVNERGSKVGKVTDYTLDTAGFLIEQISVKRPLFKSLNDTELLIHRSQITEVNDTTIIIHSEAKIPEPLIDTVKTAYANPFRKSPQAEHIDQE